MTFEHDEVSEVDEAPEPMDGVFVDLAEAEIVPPQWIIQDLLPPGLVVVGAPPKTGKSTFSMILATLVAEWGCKALPPFMSEVVSPGTVMVFSGEANAGELKHMVQEGLGIDSPPSNASIIICEDPFQWRLDDKDGLKRLMSWLEYRKPRVVIIDPLRNFHEGEEKDSRDMVRILRPLRKWAVENNAAVILVHHTRKKDGQSQGASYDYDDLRGSGAIFGLADALLMFTPLQNGLTRIKSTFKRAAGWERTLRMAIYANAGQPATEQLGDIDQATLKFLAEAGPLTQAILAKQLHTDERVMSETLAKLGRNSLAVKLTDGRWKKL